MSRPERPSPIASPRLGAHLSIAGGPHNAANAAAALRCDTLQIFVKNQRQWRARPLEEDVASQFRRSATAASLRPIVAHAAYLINLAAPSSDVRNQSIAAMADELVRCEQLGVDYLVVHPGAHMDETLSQGIKQIVQSLNRIHRDTAGMNTRILLEATAGQGSAIGHRFEHLRDIIAGVKKPERLGVCLDTCHLFAAGYDFRKPEDYAATIDQFSEIVGLEQVRCIHVNDSKRELGSRVDRHEHIGKGKIGNAGFRHFLNDPRFADLPFILETPKGTDGRGTDLDKVNLRRLRSLVG